jgi:hypothetical protein
MSLAGFVVSAGSWLFSALPCFVVVAADGSLCLRLLLEGGKELGYTQRWFSAMLLRPDV